MMAYRALHDLASANLRISLLTILSTAALRVVSVLQTCPVAPALGTLHLSRLSETLPSLLYAAHFFRSQFHQILPGSFL